MAPVSRFWAWMTTSPPGPRSRGAIVAWWEKRRIPYNLLVGGVGVISLVLFYWVMGQPGMLAPGEDAVEPFAVCLAPIAVNICYTAGATVELLFGGTRRVEPLGPRLMRMGLWFSLVAVWIPTLTSVARLLRHPS